jgi:hypothetical protein
LSEISFSRKLPLEFKVLLDKSERHYNDDWIDLFILSQFVENRGYFSVYFPRVFVVTDTVQQVQHGVGKSFLAVGGEKHAATREWVWRAIAGGIGVVLEFAGTSAVAVLHLRCHLIRAGPL